MALHCFVKIDTLVVMMIVAFRFDEGFNNVFCFVICQNRHIGGYDDFAVLGLTTNARMASP